MTRRWGRDRRIRSLSDVLGRTPSLRRARVPLGLEEAWSRALGPAARHTRLVRLRGRVLEVAVDTPSWTAQLESMAEALGERLFELGFDVDRVVVQGPRGKGRPPRR